MANARLQSLLGFCGKCSGSAGVPRSGLGEAADEPGGALGVAFKPLEQLVAGEAGLEGFGIEVGGDQGERVVMVVAGRRTRPEIVWRPAEALSADIFIGRH